MIGKHHDGSTVKSGCGRLVGRLLKIISVGAAMTCLASAPASAQLARVPTLEVVAKDGGHSTLIGSMHVGMRDVLKPNLIALFANAKRFVVEHTNSLPPEEENLGARAPWAAQLSDVQVEILVKRAACAGVPRSEALRFLEHRSAQRANQAAYTVCGDEGRSKSMDSWIGDHWARFGRSKPEVLEEDTWMREHRKRVRDEDSAAALQWILDRDPEAVLQSVVFALNRGDYEALARIQMESFADPLVAQRFNQVMLAERNLHWMPRLTRFLDEGGAVIVVGAMHLPGPNGLVSLLRAQGYEVKHGSVLAFIEASH